MMKINGNVLKHKIENGRGVLIEIKCKIARNYKDS
jgi:hypothetical protein